MILFYFNIFTHLYSEFVLDRHVISAAHCIKQKHNEKEREPNRVVLFVGKHDLENLDESEYQEVRVERFIIHPDWKVHESKYDADIAIILTETYVKYNQWVRPICLWPDNNLDLDLIKNKNGTIVGWGQTEVVNQFCMLLSLKLFFHSLQDNHHSQVPQLIEIPAKTNGDCVLSHTSFQYIISDRTFCAGNKKEIGPCNGIY